MSPETSSTALALNKMMEVDDDNDGDDNDNNGNQAVK
jgi:hypothetical protein